jgi:LacI family transcriptional regulator
LQFVKLPKMSAIRKVAFVAPVWTSWQHRLVAGALRYADAHPRIVLRGFAPAHDVARAAKEVEAWGARGVIAGFEHKDLKKFKAAMKRQIPIVNNALSNDLPNVVTLLGDFSAFVETAVGHLRQIGLRSVAIAVLEEGPKVRESLVKPFLRFAKPPNPSKATLIFSANRRVLWKPEASVTPVPPKVAKWLYALPKPTGVICCHLGGGGYIARCCRALGLSVPDDVAIVGSDDTDLSLATEPTLTSVMLSLETVGSEAMRILSDLIAGLPAPASVIRLRCADLQVRESTGRRRPEICDIVGALACIQEQACRGITVEEVRRQTQRISRVTFHRRFLQSVGKTPSQVIRERQMEEARRLLTGTELPISMIPDLCGFSDRRVLARAFLASEGFCMREYRKKFGRTLKKAV